jgi:hypothetical protein
VYHQPTLAHPAPDIAGIGLSSEVETAVYAPNGTLQWNDTIPLDILGGSPRLYDLVEVDTSGWTAGVYTITADVQLQSQPTAGGSDYGYLSVGQAVIPSHAVQPDLVAPGTVTVTTLITTEIDQSSIVNGQSPMVDESWRYTIYDAPYWNVQELAERPLVDAEETDLSEVPAAGPPPAIMTEVEVVEETAVDDQKEELRPLTFAHPDTAESVDAQPDTTTDEIEEAVESPALFSENSLLTINDTFFRVEQDDPKPLSTTGSWSNVIPIAGPAMAAIGAAPHPAVRPNLPLTVTGSTSALSLPIGVATLTSASTATARVPSTSTGVKTTRPLALSLTIWARDRTL